MRRRVVVTGASGFVGQALLVVEPRTTFVLVHGAWHGAWCWDRLGPMLQTRGHRVVAMDLPAEDGTATFDDYARAVITAMDGIDGRVVAVGHSLGGLTIPLVAAQGRVDVLVFLCGVVPLSGGNPWDDGPEMSAPGILDPLIEEADGSTRWPTLDAATAAFYADCAPADAAWAFSRLRAQNSSALWGTPYPLHKWPDARRVSIVGTEDRVVTLEWSRHVALTRLHVRPVELPASHSPMLSQPALLVDALLDAV